MKFFIFRAVSLTILLLLLQGCQDNDVPGTYPEIGSIYQQGFSLEEFQDPVIRENLVVDWSDPREFTDADGAILYEFDAQVGNGTVLEGQSSTLAQKYSVVVSKAMGAEHLEYKLVRFLSINNESLAPVSYHDKADFTGTVYHYDLKGRTEKVEGYKDGALKAVSGDSGKDVTSLASKAPKDCMPDDPYCEGGYFVYVPTQHFTDWYNVRGNRLEYSHSVYVNTTWERVFVPTHTSSPASQGYHGHIDAPAPHGPGGSGHTSNHPKEIIKDPSFIGTKADCVLETLLKQSVDFRNVMDAFTNGNSNYKIKFEVKPLSNQNSSAEAETSPPDGSNMITIRLRPSASSTNALKIAGILLHEGVHAQLQRILATGNKAEYNISTEDYKWLKELNEWWKTRSKFPITTAQHDFMAVRYVDPIAKAVRMFDNNSHLLENYMYFGWEGLFDEGNNRGLINRTQFNEYTQLAQVPLTDNHKTSCD